MIGQYQEALDQKDELLGRYQKVNAAFAANEDRFFGRSRYEPSEREKLLNGMSEINGKFITAPAEESREPLFTQARELFLRQAEFLGENVSDMQITDDALETQVRTYDLHNTSDFAFAAALMQIRMARSTPRENPPWQYAPNAEEDIEWLANHISFSRELPAPFTNPRASIRLSRMLQNLDSAGKPYPTEWGGNVEGTETSSNYARRGPHYALSEYFYKNVPEVAEGYEKVVREKRGQIGDIRYPELLSISRLSPASAEEDFVQSMALFLQNGESFRRKITFAKLLGREGEVLQAKYDYFVKALGFETSVGARPTTVESFTVGELVQVVDQQPELSGDVHIAEEVSAEVQIGGRTVKNGDIVKIVDEPKTALDYDAREAFLMYPVLKGEVGEVVDNVWVPTPGQAKGWLSAMWMQRSQPDINR